MSQQVQTRPSNQAAIEPEKSIAPADEEANQPPAAQSEEGNNEPERTIEYVKGWRRVVLTVG
jgi:hypothetical protein